MKYDGFGLSINQEIYDLASEILGKEGIEEIDNLSSLIQSKKTRETAIKLLQDKVGYRPKRPVYYLWLDIRDLPGRTRDIARYAGDFIDELMKYLSSEKGNFIKRFRAPYTSLANNINWSKDVLGPELTSLLSKFEKIIYTPAKHQMKIPENRLHLFSMKEAVAICLITKKLSKQIIALSESARIYSLDQIFNHDH